MRRPATTVLLVGLSALALGACATSHGPATTATTPTATAQPAPATTPTTTTPAPAPADAFPVALPSQTQLAFALRDTGYLLTGTRQKLHSTSEALAITRGHIGYVACRAGVPLHSVGVVSPAVVSRLSSALRSAHLATIRSDAVPGRGRTYWFDDGAHMVTLDFARHVHRAPCTGAMCAAMISMDGSLRAVVPATVAATSFIGSHCAAG